jgi:hypothetical protein
MTSRGPGLGSGGFVPPRLTPVVGPGCTVPIAFLIALTVAPGLLMQPFARAPFWHNQPPSLTWPVLPGRDLGACE